MTHSLCYKYRNFGASFSQSSFQKIAAAKISLRDYQIYRKVHSATCEITAGCKSTETLLDCFSGRTDRKPMQVYGWADINLPLSPCSLGHNKYICSQPHNTSRIGADRSATLIYWRLLLNSHRITSKSSLLKFSRRTFYGSPAELVQKCEKDLSPGSH